MRRRKILVAGTVFLVLLIAVGWFFGGGGSGQKLKASVGFLGYTNLQDGTLRALFSVTNQSRVRLEVGAWFTGLKQGTNQTA